MASCGETLWVPEDVEVTFSPVIDCLIVKVEGESKDGCGGAEVVMTNGCADAVVFAGWSFTCGEAACTSIPAGQQGRTPIDIENKEEATFTFDGSLGLETLQVVVKMSVDKQTPGCAVANGAVGAGPSAEASAWLTLALVLGLTLRRARPRRGENRGLRAVR
jgi:hypothetical protein